MISHISTGMQNQMLHKSMSPLDTQRHVFPDITSAKSTKHFSSGCGVYVSGGYDYVMKIILLGDQGVGKTSFMKALKVHPDVTKVKCKCRVAHALDHLEVEVYTSMGKTALIRLYDTGGQERYRSLTSSYYRGAHGVLLMFDLRNSRSLVNVEQWLSDLDTFSSAKTCTRVLLGTNCASPDRAVTPHAARKYSESRGLPFMEVDTSQYYNLVESLQMIVDRIAMDVSIPPVSSTVIRPSHSPQGEQKGEDKRVFTCMC